MRRFINKVTVTGADDSIDIKDLFEIQSEYPFVEFGILLSEKYSLDETVNFNRFPSKTWLNQLVIENGYHAIKLNLAGHICGKWTIKTLKGSFPEFEKINVDFAKQFSRWQINTHAEYHIVNVLDLGIILNKLKTCNQTVIFQLDGVNDIVPLLLQCHPYDNISGLHDLSHGAGVLPKNWPGAIKNLYCGYAGGLSPENVIEQIEKIAIIPNLNNIWIDAETHLRSADNRRFDLKKVIKFLENCKPYIVNIN